MKLRSDTSIKTDRLWLRQIDETDAEAIVSLRSDEEVYRYFLNPVRITVDAHKVWYKEQYSSDDNRIDGIAVDDETGTFIGVYGVKKDVDGTVEVSYITHPIYKGYGYASEAIESVIKWSVDKWNIRTVKVIILIKTKFLLVLQRVWGLEP